MDARRDVVFESSTRIEHLGLMAAMFDEIGIDAVIVTYGEEKTFVLP